MTWRVLLYYKSKKRGQSQGRTIEWTDQQRLRTHFYRLKHTNETLKCQILCLRLNILVFTRQLGNSDS